MASTSKIRKFRHNFSAPNSAPAMPPEIQTSLLQVGMRVRKSVGQGYRTQLALEEAKMRLEREDAVRLAASSTFGGAGIYRQGAVAVHDRLVEEDEDENGTLLMSSQESNSSVESRLDSALGSTLRVLPSVVRKRAIGDEEDWTTGSGEDGISNNMDAVSTCLRPIAQAKSRRRRPGIIVREGMEGLEKTRGIHNSVMDDFEEANFLDYSHRAKDTRGIFDGGHDL